MDKRDKEEPVEPPKNTADSPANDPDVERSIREGQQAIEASRLSDAKPASEEEWNKKEQEDAEKWRNEG